MGGVSKDGEHGEKVAKDTKNKEDGADEEWIRTMKIGMLDETANMREC